MRKKRLREAQGGTEVDWLDCSSPFRRRSTETGPLVEWNVLLDRTLPREGIA